MFNQLFKHLDDSVSQSLHVIASSQTWNVNSVHLLDVCAPGESPDMLTLGTVSLGNV